MILSGALCGQIADRTGRSDLILTFCLCCAMASLARVTLPCAVVVSISISCSRISRPSAW